MSLDLFWIGEGNRFQASSWISGMLMVVVNTISTVSAAGDISSRIPMDGYTLKTVLPGLYPGRTRHYHVRVQAANGPILTTQLYFPGEERNDKDSLFRPDLLVKMREIKAERIASFNFVLAG